MKIGIITFHDAYSFGASLQCYALQKYLRGQGYQAEIIDYSMNGYQELRQKQGAGFWIKKSLNILRHPVKRYKLVQNEREKHKKQQDFKTELENRNEKFRKFWKEEYKTNGVRYDTYSEIRSDCPKYDAYICGSDQIWNPHFCDMDDTYYLAFAPEEKRIAYAPSIGVNSLTPEQGNKIKSRVEKIPFLSVREDSAGRLLEDLTGREIDVVLDPTFLLEKEQWAEVAEKSDLSIEEPYILTYFIGDDDYIQSYISEAEKRFAGYKIINLVFDYCDLGPCDFVKLLMNARFVVTNSFHGIALCINLNTPFAIGKSSKDYNPGSGFGRMIFLLEHLGIQDRILTKEMDLAKISEEMDFTQVNQKRKIWQEKSEEFLKSALDSLGE